MAAQVSVITTVYNGLPYLWEAIRSVEKQTIGFQNIEYILVDDCSNDGSYEFLMEWKKKRSNVKLLRTQSNSGSENKPRNIGLQNVTTDYVMFLDADDLLKKKRCQFSVSGNHAKSRGYGKHGLCGVFVAQQKKQMQPYGEKMREGIYHLDQDNVDEVPIMNPITTKIYRSALLKEKQLFFDESLINGGDNVFLFQYMLHINTIKYTRYAGYFYRIRLDSLSHAYSKKYFLNMLNTIAALKKLYDKTSFYEYYRMFLTTRVDIFMDLLCDCEVLSNEDTEEIL